VVALVLGVFKFKRDLNEPFTLWYNREVAEVEERRSQRLAGGAKLEPSMAEMMLLDTDQDGLSDYEELYVFNTSPYLDDSDSDGLLDGAEVKNSTDPNCPQGQNCAATSEPSTDAEKLTQSTDLNIEGDPLSLPLSSAGLLGSDLLGPGLPATASPLTSLGALSGGLGGVTQTLLPGANSDSAIGLDSELADLLKMLQSPDPQMLRQSLLDAGVTPQELESVDDQTLLEVFQQTMLEISPKNAF